MYEKFGVKFSSYKPGFTVHGELHDLVCTSRLFFFNSYPVFFFRLLNCDQICLELICFIFWQMQELENKLKKEMKDSAQIIACRFPLPNWKPCSQIEEGVDSVWLYRKH